LAKELTRTCRSTARRSACRFSVMRSKTIAGENISKAAEQLSPVVQVRQIPPLTRLLLFVRAGGRCEFDGCTRYLIEHPVTLTEGNFAQIAHIVAFRPDGPRGRTKLRPSYIHDSSNLMLLCPQCHKLIDDHPLDYTRHTLSEYKRRHEKWIRQVTGLSPDRKTSLITFTAPIGRQTVSIPFDHMLEAVAPRYPVSRVGLEINLTNLLEESSSVTQVAQENISALLSHFFKPGGEWQQAGHVSLFALGPMPLLVFLGSKLSNKVPLDLYQRHRDTETWTWKKSGSSVKYKFRKLQSGSDRKRAALLLCLSGTGPRENLPSEIDSTYFIYELTLSGRTPSPTFLRLRADLENFRIAYQQAVAEIAETQGNPDEIHLFPAVPAPVAVLCGRETLPKIHPALLVYDYSKAKGGFTYQLKVNE
jgi:SMODS-associated and fused to various effectors sensor domain